VRFTASVIEPQPIALYVGATADTALAFGAGVKVLVGGPQQQITLQPGRGNRASTSPSA
jgi:Protein of unknown function (DUF992)